MQANIGNQEDRQKILDGALAAFGRVDVLVNNAGVAPKVRADLLDMSEESFDYVVGINTKGNMFLTQLIAKTNDSTGTFGWPQGCDRQRIQLQFGRIFYQSW